MQTQYQALRCAWVDTEGAEVLGLDTFDALRTALRPPSLAALDHLLACRLAWVLKQALRHLQQQLRNGVCPSRSCDCLPVLQVVILDGGLQRVQRVLICPVAMPLS